MRRTGLWVGVLALCAGGVRAEKTYSMEDLQALQKSGGYQELVEHLGDIGPAKRDAAWEKLAEAGAVGWLATLHEDNNPFVAVVAADDLAKKYPVLKKSKPFMQKRGELGVAGLEACYGLRWADGECNTKFLAYVGDDADLALKAGRVVLKNQFAYFAVPFFERAVKGSADACKDEGVLRATMAGLGLPKDDPKVAPTKAIAEACFATMKDPIVDELAKGNSYHRDNACPLLLKKKALGGLMQKRCEAAGK